MIQTAEKALAAFIRGHRDVETADDETSSRAPDFTCQRDGALFNVPVIEGRNTAQRAATCVLVIGQQAEKPWQDYEMTECRLEVQVRTHRNTDEDNIEKAEAAHNQRTDAVFNLLLTDAAAKADLNQPASGTTDRRDVRPFHLQGMYIETQIGTMQDDALVETLGVVMWAAPFDVPA